MSINQIKAGSIISYIQMFLSVAIGLVYTPIMLRMLGRNEFGLYNTVSSTISMLSVLSLGFNSSYIRYFAKYKTQKDEEAISRLNGLFIVIFCIIGAVALLCGLFLSFNLRMVFDRGLTDEEYEISKTLMLLLTVNLAISFPMSVFQSIISAHERFVFLKLLGMLKTVVGPLVTIPLLLWGFRSVGVVSVTLGISLVTDVLYLVYTKKILGVKFCFSRFEKNLFRDLLVFTSFIALNLIVDQINNNVGKFLLGRFRGTATVAIYSVGLSLYNYYMLFSTAISSLFTPRIHHIVNSTKYQLLQQKVQLTELFMRVGRIQFLILALIATGMVFFGKEFILLWAGEGYDESYFVMLLFVLPATIPLIQNIGIEVQRAQNLHRFRSLLYILMAAINLVATVILCQIYGATGAAIGTAISVLVANGVIINIYYHKKCNIDVVCFWKSIFRLSLGLIFPVVCGGLMKCVIHSTSIGVLAAEILVYALIYCLSMWVAGMNLYEKNLVMKTVGRLLPGCLRNGTN